MTLTIANVLESLDATIRRMDPQPIIIGHSFGGLFAQLLAYRGLGSAVVGLDSTAPAGVLSLPFSTIKASAPVLANPLNIGGATMLTPEQFQYAFTNTITAEESKLLYDRFAIPCANRILFEGAFENFAPHSPARIESAEDRPPILLVAGGADHLVTPSYTKSNFDLISASEATTAYKEFPGRPHFTGAVEGWEEVADFVLAWALNPVARHPDPVDSFRS
jgi:pimeloyl-ACP methyl ester carboxylesterase